MSTQSALVQTIIHKALHVLMWLAYKPFLAVCSSRLHDETNGSAKVATSLSAAGGLLHQLLLQAKNVS